MLNQLSQRPSNEQRPWNAQLAPRLLVPQLPARRRDVHQRVAACYSDVDLRGAADGDGQGSGLAERRRTGRVGSRLGALLGG